MARKRKIITTTLGFVYRYFICATDIQMVDVPNFDYIDYDTVSCVEDNGKCYNWYVTNMLRDCFEYYHEIFPEIYMTYSEVFDNYVIGIPNDIGAWHEYKIKAHVDGISTQFNLYNILLASEKELKDNGKTLTCGYNSFNNFIEHYKKVRNW